MNNATWACFTCRETVRRPTYTLSAVPCPSCGEVMSYLGDRIRIPAQRNVKAWGALWRSICESTNPITKTPDWFREWHISRLEATIARLEATRPNPVRKARIESYRKQVVFYRRDRKGSEPS